MSVKSSKFPGERCRGQAESLRWHSLELCRSLRRGRRSGTLVLCSWVGETHWFRAAGVMEISHFFFSLGLWERADQGCLSEFQWKKREAELMLPRGVRPGLGPAAASSSLGSSLGREGSIPSL